MVRRRNKKNSYLLNRLPQTTKEKPKKLLKTNGTLKNELKEKFIFLYLYGLNTQDIKSLIKTLELPVIITKEIQYADAILALTNLVKNNRKLKQISHSKKITIHSIQKNSLLSIAKVLRVIAKSKISKPQQEKLEKAKVTRILSEEFITPLEETRLAIEELVLVKKFQSI